jgi:hypothetical protein
MTDFIGQGGFISYNVGYLLVIIVLHHIPAHFVIYIKLNFCLPFKLLIFFFFFGFSLLLPKQA